MNNVTYYCNRCGSTDVLSDALVGLNDPNDVQTYDTTYCRGCDSDDVSVTEIEDDSGDVDVVPRDMLGEARQGNFPKPWIVQWPDGAHLSFDTEEEACALQRHVRAGAGLDPMTGERPATERKKADDTEGGDLD